MATEEWDLIDKMQYDFEDYYCAFLDILGYKEKMNLFFKTNLIYMAEFNGRCAEPE